MTVQQRDFASHPMAGGTDVDPAGAPAGSKTGEAGERRGGINLDPLVLWGLGFVVAAAIVFLLGWFGIARNNEEWRQLPILISAGGAGALLLAIGSALFGANEHRMDRAAMRALLGRIESLERSIGDIRRSQEELADRLESLSYGQVVDREVAAATSGNRKKGPA